MDLNTHLVHHEFRSPNLLWVKMFAVVRQKYGLTEELPDTTRWTISLTVPAELQAAHLNKGKDACLHRPFKIKYKTCAASSLPSVLETSVLE